MPLAEPPPGPPPAAVQQLSAAELFALADAALGRADMRTALAIYRALTDDADQRIRSEARFRLAMVLARRGSLTEAAGLLRRILDDEPGAQRVRLELARLLERLGDEAGARRALRQAQAGGLPPDVARLVDRYSDALRAQKPLGASLEVALAPDSNVNRATRSAKLATVLGDFALDEDARQRSGVGLAIDGQVYARLRLGDRSGLLVRLNGSGRFYGHGAFNDVALGLSAGPELRLGADRLTAEVGASRRWFGGKPYAAIASATLNYFHPLDRPAQLRLFAAFGVIDHRPSRLQDGRSFALSAGYERALSNRAGIGLTLAAERQALRDPAYSTWSGSVTLSAYREIGAATVVATLAHGRLRADARLPVYPRRRADTFDRGSLAVTWRRLALGGFAPLLRLAADDNRSRIELYRYRRLRAEIGITRAF